MPKNSNDSGKKIKAGKANNAMGEYWEFVPVQGQANTYYIRSFCGKCLDAEGGSSQPGTNLIQWDYNGGENQMWIIKPEQGGNVLFNAHQDYIITSAVNHSMALDVSQGHQNKHKMILWNKHGNQNQRWKIKEMNGKFILMSGAGGVLEVPQGSQNNGTHISVGMANNQVNEYWDIIPVQGHKHKFYIRSFCGKALDVSEGSTQPNTHIIQWDFHGGENQMWRIEKA